jgi:predicted AAA+ superfamily ATPase
MSELETVLARAEALLLRIERLLPGDSGEPRWEDHVCAFRWRSQGYRGYLQSVRCLSSVRLEDLQCIDAQKQQVDRNTRQFMARLPANNVLLWGPRGTGKSSLIKALLNQYAGEGLRLIEVDKPHLMALPDIVECLYRRPERFILFCDDLSFAANDASYKILKAALDGSVHSLPDNVLVYATSNRRHLLPEDLRENLDTRSLGGEIHPAEASEEKISLSERFGLWLAFHPFSQEDYLKIVYYWLNKLAVPLEDSASIRREALQWALLHGSRSGRSAWQFARDLAGRVGLERMAR